MGKIALLSDNMVNMIAAGEVIERPASVVKELLENAIDAGAKRITVNVEDGGRKCIQVIDDGSGMEADDLDLAFEPHATSKIRTADDLDAIVTMGFRGEALASIASVARVTVTTRTPGSVGGHTLTVDCGDKTPLRPAPGAVGTDIQVRNLFYKLPVRRKFLRTANTEMTHITEYFTRIALVHTTLDLTLIHNGRTLYHLLPGQSTQDRIRELLGPAVAEDLVPSQSKEKGIEIRALLGKPAAAKSTAKYQYTFLNGRYIRDKFIQHAIREAYRGLLESGRYPPVFLFLQMDPSGYDVNVHPTKIEVRFENANLVYSQVLAVMREKLLNLNLDVQAGFSAATVTPRADLPEEPDSDERTERIRAAMAEFFKNQPPASQRQFEFKPAPSFNSAGRSQGPARPPAPFSGPAAFPKPLPDLPDFDAASPAGGSFLQIHDSYILVQTPEGFDIIDQHALHERILYEKLAARLETEPLQSQRLLVPETLQINDAQVRALEARADLIRKLGIEIAPFGPKTIAVQAFPTILSKVDPAEFVRDMLDRMTDTSPGLDAEKLLHEILDMAACKAAVKAGQKLAPDEIARLLDDKALALRSSRCPHGRPTTIRFSLTQLEKQFKRT